ncbi:hypothetical protein [Nitratireductor soli]|uniref:hypothetical protein n=1 Tax=Nitratireductor soli TaxID=1670619 RepID=UPI00065DDFF4|nr:hypothetical protein [Nitratireductor soli]
MTHSGPPGAEQEFTEQDFTVHDAEDDIPAEAEGLAGTLLLAVTLVLIVLAPFATRSQPADKAWFLAPINWPLLALGMAALAGGIMAWRFVADWRAGGAAFRSRALWALGGFRGALEYSLYFCLYLLGVAWLGFAIATLVFLQFIVWRSGLRGARWVVTALLVTVAIVVVFRLGIGLWFPLSPLLKLFPGWVGNMLGGVL